MTQQVSVPQAHGPLGELEGLVPPSWLRSRCGSSGSLARVSAGPRGHGPGTSHIASAAAYTRVVVGGTSQAPWSHSGRCALGCCRPFMDIRNSLLQKSFSVKS